MEKKPVYKQLPGCRVTVCSGEIAVDMRGYCKKHLYLAPQESKRKPVYCAHPNIVGSITPYFNKCVMCGIEWDCMKEPPQRVIGYVEADNGK